VETEGYYHDHLDRLDEGPSPLPDMTKAEMLVFLAITVQIKYKGRVIFLHPRNTNFLISKFTNCVTRLDTLMI